MTPVGPLKFKRMPERVRRQIDVAAASAWEAIVEVHAEHALRFVALLSLRSPFDEAVSRYLDEMDVRDPMASSIRSRVLIALEDARDQGERSPPGSAPESGDPSSAEDGDGSPPEDGDGLRRFRPDVLMKGIARRVRETGEAEQWVALAIARAEEAIIRAHISNAITLSEILASHAALDEAVEEYIDLMRISGGRAQAVFQRTMARLADLHLPDDAGGRREESKARNGAGTEAR